MMESRSGYSISRSSRPLDCIMIVVCVMFVFAMCTSFSAAAQNPNLLDQMEGDFNELSDKAFSWSMNSESNTDTLAQNAYDIGLRSDYADWVLEPEDGYIEVVDYYLPHGDIPLWIDQAWLDQFYVTISVYGGYELLDTWLVLEQKGEYYYIDIVLRDRWTIDCFEYYTFGLELPDGVTEYSFDANNFPDVSAPFSIYHDPDYDDLQKEIYVYFCSLWTGCDLPAQEFTISSVHSYVGALSYVSPSPYYIR
ncbi:MAG: hypothetical protein ACW975_05020 [Candidatus Thorarchaeota archaeon]